MRTVILRLFLVLAVLLPAGAAIAAEPFEVDLNKGRLLRLSENAESVFVANPEVADIQLVSPKIVYVFGRSPGETNLFAIADGDRVLVNTVVKVNQNLGGLNRALMELLPGENVNVQSMQGGLVLTGAVNDAYAAADAERVAARYVGEGGTVINRLALRSSNQIHLRVRVAEVSRTVDKTFGINWDAVGSIGDFVFGLATGRSVFNAAGEISRGGFDNVFLGYSGDNFDVNALVDALSDNGFITILAEPNLTALSGETASFLAGGEFPIPVAQEDGNTTIEFKEFGVQLNFTPTMINGGRINLKVRPEVSQVSDAGAIVLQQEAGDTVVPSLITRRAETTVEVGSGQSFAIAGLLQNNINQTIDKFPMLGDIPVLGALFRSDKFQRDETELVIIVTPYLVKPFDAIDASLPTDGLKPPTDTDRVLHGRNTASSINSGGGDEPNPSPAPVGSVSALPVTSETASAGQQALTAGFTWE